MTNQINNTTPQLALVLRGHYLMKTMIAPVAKMTDEETKSYREDLRDRMHKTIEIEKQIEIADRDVSPTIKTITDREDNGELHVESRIYYITQDEADAILAEIASAANAKADAEQARKDRAANDRQAKYDEAASTGKPVRIRSWMEECNDPREIDCSMDVVTEYAMPDGTTKIERKHAH